ncbi:hypothetical protein ACL6C3_03025 [Capilliphycus salinus ALCB114379]|uniref:hypothetical protein n=1 Tax=Capilliphycus salinus TaxID=2768948 RepID=UPI0039A664D7
MTDIYKLINQLSESENQLSSTQFIAPCVRGGKVKTQILGLVYTFAPQPNNFEGWGIFKPINQKTAEVLEEAILPEIAEYLQQFKSCRLRLAYKLRLKTWLAYPINEGDFKQRFGRVKPVVVHLVTEGVSFQQITVRWDGSNFWFEELDRRDDLITVENLQKALKELVEPQALRFAGLTPEMRTVYDLVIQQTDEFSQQYRDERRLKKALKQGGGELQTFEDRGDYWTVEWTTSEGEFHSSAISKSDLTVLGAGICLSGYDRNFDLQSLVGVVEGRENE